MKQRFASANVLALSLFLLEGCPRFQEGPVSFWGNESYVQLGRERIYLRDFGRGPALLLIHGYGSAHDTWAPLLSDLSRSYRVLAVDLPGFGRSDKYAGDYSPPALAQKLLDLLDQKGIKEAHLVAHSWGSAIALAMALQRPERVRSLTLIGAWVYEEQLPPFIRWSRAPVLGELLFSLYYGERLDDRMALAFYNPLPFTQPESVDQVRTAIGRPGAVAAALAAARGQRFTELQSRYRSVRQPVLLIWGGQDRISRLPFAHRLVNELPQGRLIVIEQCGHIPMLEQPSQVLRALHAFLPATTDDPPSRGGERR
jgi:2-hydroxymuconate-semialdehyde hydrolase